MIVVTVAALVALFAVIVLLARSQASERDAWARERSELLNRIQAPERLPVAYEAAWSEPEQDDIDPDGMVGSIVHDENYGLEDY